MIRWPTALALCSSLISANALAAEVFTGETAAILDWSVKSCEFKSTDKTRKLVEDEKAKGEAKFSESYLKGFSGKLLSEANADPQRTGKVCSQILEWFGNGGTRIAGLIAAPRQPVETATPPKQDSPKSERGRRKRAQ